MDYQQFDDLPVLGAQNEERPHACDLGLCLVIVKNDADIGIMMYLSVQIT